MSGQLALGVVDYSGESNRKTDFLYRVSLKCLVQNSQGQVLLVKEGNRDWWDLPGGGMDHGESIAASIARELAEEVSLKGDFSYRIIAVEEPKLMSTQNIWQIRLVFKVEPTDFAVAAGVNARSIEWLPAESFKNSPHRVERLVFRYYKLAQEKF
ncbi:MAG TPA: NUDIX hydrolase [Candidatus Saccharimonadales bacterium]|nr:NUDIX hydrolase [Candidatus Saccharimonadales bacterium]